jgi:hypothetical protein
LARVVVERIPHAGLLRRTYRLEDDWFLEAPGVN